MKFLNKSLVLATLLAATAVPLSTASAEEPNGTFVWNDNQNAGGSLIGVYSAQIIQNGQFVGGNHDAPIDQTTSPGSRADAVQAVLASEGRGRDK